MLKIYLRKLFAFASLNFTRLITTVPKPVTGAITGVLLVLSSLSAFSVSGITQGPFATPSNTTATAVDKNESELKKPKVVQAKVVIEHQGQTPPVNTYNNSRNYKVKLSKATIKAKTVSASTNNSVNTPASNGSTQTDTSVNNVSSGSGGSTTSSGSTTGTGSTDTGTNSTTTSTTSNTGGTIQ